MIKTSIKVNSSSKVRTLFGVIDMSQKNGFTKPFVRDKNVVDLIGSYSNLAVLNKLAAVINKTATA